MKRTSIFTALAAILAVSGSAAFAQAPHSAPEHAHQVPAVKAAPGVAQAAAPATSVSGVKDHAAAPHAENHKPKGPHQHKHEAPSEAATKSPVTAHK
jgi:hypothetical protein